MEVSRGKEVKFDKVYPVLSIGSLMVTTFFSVFIFKEKMRWWQWIGVVVGATAVGLLSI